MLGVGKMSFELKALEQEGTAQARCPRLIGKDLQIILHQRKMFNQVLDIPLAFHMLESSTSRTSSRRKRTGRSLKGRAEPGPPHRSQGVGKGKLVAESSFRHEFSATSFSKIRSVHGR